MTVSMICDELEQSIKVKRSIISDRHLIEQIEHLAMDCVTCLKAGGKVIFAGNGGSFGDAQHLSAEFVSRFMFDRAPLASIVLGANSSAISAVGNDYGYEQVFARELEALADTRDIFIPISTSGNSPNICAAVEVANAAGLGVWGLTGRGGGRLRNLCDCVLVPSTETPRIQEMHIVLGHIVCGLVERAIFPGVGKS